MEQRDFIRSLCAENPNAVFIGSLGTISYDLTEINPKNKILIKGAMGAAMSCGLGYTLGAPHKKVIVLIGDGAYLMKQGHQAEILKHNLPNLRVIILNNGKFKSCGGQATNFEAARATCPFEVIDVE